MQKLKQIKATSTNACPMGGGVVGCGGGVAGVWWGWIEAYSRVMVGLDCDDEK